MNKKLLVSVGGVLALLCGVVVLSPGVQAGAWFSTEDTSFIRAGETIDGAAFIASESVHVEGTVNGDVNCAAQTVVITGTVNGDVNCAGATVTVDGTVTGDVRVAAQNITIGGNIGGGVSAFGASVHLSTAAKIGRDGVLSGSDVLVNGSIGRDLVITAETGTVNGPVGRNVEGALGTLVIGSSGVVNGFVHFTSDNDARVNGQVKGDVTRDTPRELNGQAANVAQGVLAVVLIALVWTVSLALTLRLIAPKKMHTATALAPRDVVLATALGFVGLVTIPLIAVFLMASVVALPLGLALILAWITLCILSAGVTAIYLGRVLFKKQTIHPIAATALAALVLGILFVIPFVNVLVMLWSLAFGTGAVLYAVRGEYEPGAKGPKARLVKAQ